MLYTTPRQPSAGGRISASWGRNLIGAVRSAMPVAGPGVMLRKGFYGTSMTLMDQVRQTASAVTTATLDPFAVRWLSHDKDGTQPNKGEWQIYMPEGCATISSRFGKSSSRRLPYIPVMDKAKDAEGEEIADWYKIPTPDTSNATVTEKDDTTTYSWIVYARFAPFPKVEVTTKNTGETVKTPWETLWIARIKVAVTPAEGGGETRTRSVDQYQESNWSTSRDDYSRLSITYKTEDGESDKDAVWKPYLTQRNFIFGRETLSQTGDVDVSGQEEVVIWIQHPDETFTVDVVGKDDIEPNDDDNTYIIIYEMQNDVVTSDMRSRLTDVPWYNY